MTNVLRSPIESVMEYINKNETRVGVFYSIKNKVYADSVPVRQGESGGGFVNHGLHWSMWDSLSKAMNIPYSIDYDHFARGRVIFDQKDHKYIVYIDKKLNNSTDLSKIEKEFKLQPGGYKIEFDQHYTSKAK